MNYKTSYYWLAVSIFIQYREEWMKPIDALLMMCNHPDNDHKIITNIHSKCCNLPIDTDNPSIIGLSSDNRSLIITGISG